MQTAPNPAQLYESYFVPAMFLRWAEILVREAEVAAGQSVLDIACGTGAVARTAASALGTDGRIAALDANRAMLEVARSVPSGATVPVEWREGSAQQLPFGDAEFDVVLCQHGLQFFPDRREAVSEMKRVLRPGGRAAVLVLQELSRHPVFESVMGSLARRLGRPVSEFAVPFALADRDELEKMFGAFRTVDVRTVQIEAAFPQPGRFVDLAVQSSAAAVPAFAGLATENRAALLSGVREDVQPVLAEFVHGDLVRFPMWGHLVVAGG